MRTEEIFGRESYILESDVTSAKITKTGAHVMANLDWNMRTEAG